MHQISEVHAHTRILYVPCPVRVLVNVGGKICTCKTSGDFSVTVCTNIMHIRMHNDNIHRYEDLRLHEQLIVTSADGPADQPNESQPSSMITTNT